MKNVTKNSYGNFTTLSKMFQKMAQSSLAIALLIATVVSSGSFSVAEAKITDDILHFINPLSQQAGFPVAGEREPRYETTFVASAYSSDPWQTDARPFEPADGSDYRDDFAALGNVYAIASNDLPLGAKVKMPELYGDIVFTVRDRMNKRYTGKSRLDIYMAVGDENGEIDRDASRTKAIHFGLKRVKIQIF